MRSLENLDLSDTIIISDTIMILDIGYSINTFYNGYNGIRELNRTLRTIIFGKAFEEDKEVDLPIDISCCLALEKVTLTANHSYISKASLTAISGTWPNHSGVFCSPNLSRLVIAEGVTELKFDSADVSKGIYCVFPIVDLPSTLEKVPTKLFGYYDKSVIICRANVPPSLYYNNGAGEIFQGTKFSDSYSQIGQMTLYVPAESIDAYKESPWGVFGTILPIEE